MVERGADTVALVPVVDHYLDSVAYTLNPADYEPDFQSLLEYIGKQTPRYAWHHDRLGWFYFRTNRLDEAEEHFRTAVGLRKAEGEARNLGWTYWAISLVSLAKDDLEGAIEHAIMASDVGSEDYQLVSWATNERDFKRDFGVTELVEQYDHLKDNMPAFFDEMNGRQEGEWCDSVLVEV